MSVAITLFLLSWLERPKTRNMPLDGALVFQHMQQQGCWFGQNLLG